jgi:uncharacterized lipoprotein YehR (DUF1307 family)
MKRKQLASLIILISLLFTMIIGCGDNTSSKNIKLIKEGKYEEAAIWLFNENAALYSYCRAKIAYSQGDYRMGKSYLNDIEETYSGPLNKEVMNYKEEMEEKNIEYGFQEIANKNYDEAAQWFFEISEYDKNLFKLYSYARSLQSYVEIIC